jgi:hypothetical protein
MKLQVRENLADIIGKKKLVPFGLSEDGWSWNHTEPRDINLAEMGPKKIRQLEELLTRHKGAHGAAVLLKDIARWIEAINNTGKVKPRTLEQFEAMLIVYLQDIPGHRVYSPADGDVWLAYYVEEVVYHEASSCPYHPPFVTVDLWWEEFGGKRSKRVIIYNEDCAGATVIEALARKGYYAETEEYRTAYLKEVKRFAEITPLIGKQFLAHGTATDDVDGNPGGRDNSWYWRRTNTLKMGTFDEPVRCVIDLFHESDEVNRDRYEHMSEFFWHTKIRKDDDDEKIPDLDNDEREPIEVPIHPNVCIFHLAKHLRMRIHVGFLREYVYDKNLIHKLILNDELKSLVTMLVQHKEANFVDIVKGKSGGAVVLLSGKPGVGKTLTAEVYAESEGRALYSVQCSQLGTDPNELEDELLKVFARAKRWDAVMLLDEADVYVHERGRDMQQNAIVGVFLRVLEYQDSVLFLTTNRPDDVDDAIASRCVARLDYKLPTDNEQREIWKVLSKGANINLTDKTIDTVVLQNPSISGRDIKNLLKLALLVRGRSKPIRPEDILFVKQFQPTRSFDH